MTQWKPIESAPKRIKKGYMRLYSFKPVVNKNDKNWSLPRAYQFNFRMGSRVCDLYMDITIPHKGESND